MSQVLLFVIAFVSCAWAQSLSFGTGTAKGIVEFAQPAAKAPNVLVTARGISDFRNVRTSNDGSFKFSLLPLGRWDLVASAKGYCQQQPVIVDLFSYNASVLTTTLLLWPRCAAGWTTVKWSPPTSAVGNLRVRSSVVRDGDFTFFFAVSYVPNGGAQVRIDQVEVSQDGGDSAMWFFEVFANNNSVLTIDPKKYDSKVRTYKIGLVSKSFSTKASLDLRIVGQNKGHGNTRLP